MEKNSKINFFVTFSIKRCVVKGFPLYYRVLLRCLFVACLNCGEKSFQIAHVDLVFQSPHLPVLLLLLNTNNKNVHYIFACTFYAACGAVLSVTVICINSLKWFGIFHCTGPNACLILFH